MHRLVEDPPMIYYISLFTLVFFTGPCLACDDGFYVDVGGDYDCYKCSACTEGGDKIQSCLSQGLPEENSCAQTFLQREPYQAVILPRELEDVSSPPTKGEAIVTVPSVDGKVGIVIDPDTGPVDFFKALPREHKKAHDSFPAWAIVLLAFVVVISILVAIIVVTLACKHYTRRTTNTADCESCIKRCDSLVPQDNVPGETQQPLLKDGKPELPPTYVENCQSIVDILRQRSVPVDTSLAKISRKAKDYLTKALQDSKMSWRLVAEKLNVPGDEIDYFEHGKDIKPVDSMFEYLAEHMTVLTIGDLFIAMENLAGPIEGLRDILLEETRASPILEAQT